jgi:5-hydroxyisourate hydrolase-like protein (transthyretin family)
MIRFFFCGLLIVHLYSCATPTTPTGGPRDENPPLIDTALSTPNFQTGFLKQTITLTFNEWVMLEDVFNQVIISPPLQFKPEIYIKKKGVIIEWDERETLRENVTYTFNFGESVKDLTEKNPAEKLRFVFSTGEYIDSLSLSGKVVNATDGKPLEKIKVMLYASKEDSVVRKQKPLYLSLTDKEGRFTMENVRSDTFSLFALEDINFNYKFDLANERIGFPDSLLFLTGSLTDSIVLQVFQEKPELRRNATDMKAYGIARILYNQAPDKVLIFADSSAPILYREHNKDTLILWFNPISSISPWEIRVQSGLTTFDTLRFTPPSSTQLPNIGNLYLENTTENGISRQTIKSGAPVLISLTRPVFSFDPTKIIQVRDSLPLSDTLYFSRDSIYPRRLSLYGRWQEGKTYKIIIPPGTIQDIYGKTTDSLKFTFNIGKTEEYGNVAVTFSNEDSLMHYVVQIIDDSQRIYYENRIFGKSPEAISLNLLLPGKYMLKVIRDENNNGSWDTGNLSLHRQPEKIVLITLEEIKANWDVETAVNLAEIFKQ